MRWNKIGTFGIKLIAEALVTNTNLAVLDISHNGLGHKKLLNTHFLIKTISTKKSSLVHLDLSFNGII